MANPSPIPTPHPSMPAPPKAAAKAPPKGFQYAGHSPNFKLPAGATGKLVRTPAPRVSGSASNPLLDPNATLSGSALNTAANALADAQVKGPITQLSQQIAQNQKQTGAAQKTTAGYFNNLGQFVNQGNQQLGGISAGLNQTLENIGNQSRWNTASAFGPSQPLQNLGRQGLAQGAADALQKDQANQMGFATQDGQTYRSAGALQGANQQGLGASMLGTFGTRGMETIGRIGQAGQLENVPLNQKIGDLKASRGALYTTALGKLRQAEISNSITRQGLGIKQNAIDSANARTAAQIQAANARSANSISATNMRSDRTYQLDVKKFGAAQARNNYLKAHGLGPYKPAAGKTGKTISPIQNNHYLGTLDRLENAITTMQQQGIKDKKGKVLTAKPSESQIRQALGGVDPTGGVLTQAAYELNGWGFITPSTSNQLKSLGIRNAYFRGKPITVRNAPPPASGTLGGFLGSSRVTG